MGAGSSSPSFSKANRRRRFEVGVRRSGKTPQIPEQIRSIYYVPSKSGPWSVSIVDLGKPGLKLRVALVVMLEENGAEFLASWPEVEAWGAGATEADAINELKDEILRLYTDLSGSDDASLGKLPRRWKASLSAIIDAVPAEAS